MSKQNIPIGDSSNLAQEILEQPRVFRRQLDQEQENIARIAAAIGERHPRYLVIAARGTSDNAARYAKYLLGAYNELPVALATPSLFTKYERPPRMEDALVLGISQSGASPDIVSVLAEGSRQGALTVAITNEPDSDLAQTAAHTIQLHAGAEKSVAATKTYTASLLAVATLSALLANDAGRLDWLVRLPDIADQVLDAAQATIQSAERYRYMQWCVVVGRGYNYATTFEIALKLKELTYVLADPYSSADFQHGPVALIEQGFPVLAIVPEGRITDEMMTLLDQLRDREAELLVISSLDPALDMAQTPLPLPAGVPEWLSPLIAVMPGQLFALGLTLTKGFDPDHPRGLHKVTLTR
jgi:glucosamine--fructose-6-phosphate aminotransferase (isomerizing)